MHSETVGTTTTCFVSGDLDVATVELIRVSIDAVMVERPDMTRLVLDLGQSAWVDSVGLGLLVAVRSACLAQNVDLMLGKLSHRMHRILVLSGLETFFEVDPDSPEAPVLTCRYPLPETMPISAAADRKFDQIAELTRRAVGAQQAFVTMLDTKRIVFPGAAGLPAEASRERPISHALCEHVVTSGQPLVLNDTRASALVRDNPAVLEGLAAYAGMPLVDLHGRTVGTLCVADDQPRTWSEAQLRDLADLAAVASSELQLRMAVSASAVSADRIRIANELNERVINELLSLSMLIGSAQSITAGRAGDLLDEAATKVDDVLASLRSTIFARV